MPNRMIIDGEWTDGRATESREIRSPATREVVGSHPVSTREDIDESVAAARRGHAELEAMTVHERAELLHRAAPHRHGRGRDRHADLQGGLVRAARPGHDVSSDDEAIWMANDKNLGLQAAVFTSSLKRAFPFMNEIRVGNLQINESTAYWEGRPPFGGAAGTKTGWGRIQLEDFTDVRTVTVDYEHTRD